MTQQIIHTKVSLPDGVTFEDTASFSFTAEATGSDASITLSELTTAVAVLLNTASGAQAHPLSYYIGPSVTRATLGIGLTFTDVTAHLDGSPAGSPIGTDALTLGAAGPQAGLPPGLAICCGYRAAYSSDIEHGPAAVLPNPDEAIDVGAPATHTGLTRPRARDRSRFYLGPLTIQTLDTVAGGSSGPGAVGAVALADFQIALDTFLKTHNLSAHDQWNVVCWSRRAAAVKNAAFYFVDEGLAYQRRREDVTLNRVHSWTAV